ncbi:hypothetical protein B0H15DRAFT_771078, partial [Mycena belliarum]
MSVHIKPDAEGIYSYDEMQKDILNDLPSSLYTSMNRLNLDGKTVLYAACPHPRPIRPFLSYSFLDYLARLLSTPEIERQMDQSCDEALNWKAKGGEDFVDNVFHGTLIQGFMGPDGKLFIDRGSKKRMRLLFGFSLDFFPPHGSRKRSSSASIGVLSVYCLNLPLTIRHAPQNIYISVITGPKAPHQEHLNPYLRPMVDIGVIGWERG